MGGTLLDYGIAVNFFGNYRQEANELDRLTGRLNGSLASLQRLVIGGGITAGLYKFSSAILGVAKTMEQNFASLQSTLGSAAKAIETLEWARQKGASTPFGIDEVNSAVSLMTTLGFNRDKEMRETVFNSIGDFAGLRGFNFADMMQRVAKASFGNWEALGDTFGIRQGTIGGMVKEQVARTPEKFAGEESSIAKAIQMVEKGKKGTQEYKMAIVELIGVLGRGGMKNRLDTIAGSWSNVGDIVQNFMNKMVGYSQIQGTLANTIKTTIVEKILNPFMNVHSVVINGITEQTTAVDQLGRIGKGVGEIMSSLWGMIDTQVGNSSNFIVSWIDKLDAFFRNYEQNVAPIVLFLAIVKLQVEDFIKGFYSGFKDTFNWFLDAGMGVWLMMGRIAKWLGITDTTAEGLGKTLGWVMGIMLGMKAYRIITSPFTPLIDGASMLLNKLLSVYAAQYDILAQSGQLPAMGQVFRAMVAPLTSAATASWSFTASLLANPIGLVVVAVAALVLWLGFLIYNWDEVGRSMQGTNDILLVFMSILLPIVGVPLLMAKHWNTLSTVFTNVWRIIKATFNLGVNAIKLGIQMSIIEPFNKVKNVFMDVWNWIENKFPTIAKYLKIAFAPIQYLLDGFKELWDKGGNFLSSIFSGMGEGLGTMANRAEANERVVGNTYERSVAKEKTEAEWEADRQKKYGNYIAPTVGPQIGPATAPPVTIPVVNIYMQPGETMDDAAGQVDEAIKKRVGQTGK